MFTVKPSSNANRILSEAELESADTPSVYQGKLLTVEEMDEAIASEAGKHRFKQEIAR